MPTLYFIRHGETDWNREARLQGQRDIPLNDLGRDQARKVSRHVCDVVGGLENLRRLPFLCSPLGRTRETMELLREELALPTGQYRLDDRLKELSFGDWEGLTWKELRRINPSAAAEREADKWGFAPPGGESYAMLSRRVGAWLAEITEECVVVAHGGVARTLLVLRAGYDQKRAATEDIWQGKVLVFDTAGARWVPGAGDA